MKYCRLSLNVVTPRDKLLITLTFKHNLHVHKDKQISDSESAFSSRQYHFSRSRDVRFEVFNQKHVKGIKFYITAKF